MAPRKTNGRAFMLKQLYEAENVPEEDRDTDEYVKLPVNEILSRIDKATKKTAPPDEVVYHTSHGWSGFRD